MSGALIRLRSKSGNRNRIIAINDTKRVGMATVVVLDENSEHFDTATRALDSYNSYAPFQTFTQSNLHEEPLKVLLPEGMRLRDANDSQLTEIALLALLATDETGNTTDLIQDIDLADPYLSMLHVYAKETYDTLYQLESNKPIEVNHLNGQAYVTARKRTSLICWLSKAYWKLDYRIETFQIAVRLIDYYLQAVKNLPKPKLRLLGVASLMIAAKYEEIRKQKMDDAMYISFCTFTKAQISGMEWVVLKALDFTVPRVYPSQFLTRFFKAGVFPQICNPMGKYFIELSATDYELSSYKPSQVAAAIAYLLLHLFQPNAKKTRGFNDDLWTPRLEFYSRYTADTLQGIAQKIAKLARYAYKSTTKNIYRKYKTVKYGKVALRDELYGALIHSIIKFKE